MMNKKKALDWRIVCTGLICITALEGFAIANGHNGTLLRLILVVMAAAIGIVLPTPNLK